MTKFKPAYRRAAYFGVAFVLAVLVAAGFITEAQYQSWIEIVEDALPLLGTIALSVAGVKTREGSDDPTTREDVDAAYQTAQSIYIEPAPVQRPLTVAEAEQALADALAAQEPEPETVDEAAAAYHEATRRE